MNPQKPTYNKVALMIYGNPQSAAGYQPIFHINDPRFTPPVDLSPGGMTQNDHYFVVNISQAFTNVVLIQNNVKSAGASREGILKFAMAVPKGYRLADGKTPYDFLMDVRNVFLANYMDPYGNGYQYKNPLPGPAMIQSVVDKYRFEPAALPHRQMTGQVQGYLVSNRLPELFADLQYPEFGRFREIVIGEQSAQPMNVGNIAIPRRPAWKLRVNNVMSQWPAVRDLYTDPINISWAPTNPRHYEDARILFTIAEARKGAYPEIKVDEVNEIVDVRLENKPRRKMVSVRFEGAHPNPNEMRDFTFRVGGKVVTPNANNQIELVGPEMDRPIEVDYGGTVYNMRSERNNDMIIVNLTKRPVRTAGGFNGGGNGRSAGYQNTYHQPEEKKPLTTGELLKMPSVIVALIIALLLGIIIGVGGYFAVDKLFSDRENQQEQVDVQEVDQPDSEWWKDQEEFGKMQNELNLPGLTFATVEEYGQKVDALLNNQSEEAQKAIEDNKTVIDMVGEYKKAVNAVRSANIEELKKVKLNSVHQHFISEAYYGWYTGDDMHEYTAESRDKANARFVERASGMQSFYDMGTLHEGLPEVRKKETKTETSTSTSVADKNRSNKGKKKAERSNTQTTTKSDGFE